MKHYIIKKGAHRPDKKLFRNIFSIASSLSYKFVFTESCRYDLGADQTDVNKLYGFGFITSIKKWPPHHFCSARIGWYYDNKEDHVCLVAYCYVNGERKIVPLMNVPFNRLVKTRIDIYRGCFKFYASVGGIVRSVSIESGSSFFSYKLGVYFGGRSHNIPGIDNVAPHDVEIFISKCFDELF